MRNIIRKQLIDFEYNGRREPFLLQEEVSNWCNLELLSGVAKDRDKIGSKETHIRIDKVELDVVIDDTEGWQHDLVKKVLDSLDKELFISLQRKDPEHTISQQTHQQHFFDVFIYFLQKGQLPWWSGIKRKDEFDAEVSNFIKRGLDSGMKDKLYKLSFEDSARQRVSHELSRESFVALIAALYNEKKNGIDFIFNDLLVLITTLAVEKRRLAETTFKTLLWKNASRINKTEALDISIREFLKIVRVHEHHDMISFQAMGELKSSFFKTVISETIKEDDSKVERQTLDKEKDKSRGIKKMVRESDEEGEIMYIDNAGLVIIASFLPLFFRKMNIVHEDELPEFEKAACLVHYLATGDESFAEFELGLVKVLCGIDMETPVHAVLDITENYKQESNELLLSVIEYWSILKDTSVQGLRESFLLRNGKLRFHNNEWLLQVEQKPYDMLLQSLPWNISMIRLPWMKYLLRTEWV